MCIRDSYYAVLAGINLQVRRHPRKRAIFVDEVHYMNREASLMTFLANMVKTVRTYGAAVIMIDQNLEAFIGVEGAQAESMQAGINVAAGQMILRHAGLTLTQHGDEIRIARGLLERRTSVIPRRRVQVEVPLPHVRPLPPGPEPSPPTAEMVVLTSPWPLDPDASADMAVIRAELGRMTTTSAVPFRSASARALATTISADQSATAAVG